MRVIGRVYRVMSEAYPSTARNRINLVVKCISPHFLLFDTSKPLMFVLDVLIYFLVTIASICVQI